MVVWAGAMVPANNASNAKLLMRIAVFIIAQRDPSFKGSLVKQLRLLDDCLEVPCLSCSRHGGFRQHVFDARRCTVLGRDFLPDENQAGHDGHWSWPLLAAAISRFPSALDGLAQDLFADPVFDQIVKRDIADGIHENRTGASSHATRCGPSRAERERAAHAGRRAADGNEAG